MAVAELYQRQVVCSVIQAVLGSFSANCTSQLVDFIAFINECPGCEPGGRRFNKMRLGIKNNLYFGSSITFGGAVNFC